MAVIIPGGNFEDPFFRNIGAQSAPLPSDQQDEFIKTLSGSELPEEAKRNVYEWYATPRNADLVWGIKEVALMHFQSWKNSPERVAVDFIKPFYRSQRELQLMQKTPQTIVTLVDRLYKLFANDWAEKQGIEIAQEAIRNLIPNIEEALVKQLIKKNRDYFIERAKVDIGLGRYEIVKEILQFLDKKKPTPNFKYEIIDILNEMTRRNNSEATNGQ